MATEYALSIKQPWAALLAHGKKTVEIRRWSTPRRGRVLLHAARHPDPRPSVWAMVPPELRAAAQLCGGLVGVGELSDCIEYRTAATFSRDQKLHWNDPAWFQGQLLYGFQFQNLQPLPFRPCAGRMGFFPPDETSQDRGSDLSGPTLLVSVRSVEEADAALAGGAALIDVKEPRHGSLGRADAAVLAAVVARIAGRCPVSAALGELTESPSPPAAGPLAFAKWGLSGCGGRPNWRQKLRTARDLLAGKDPSCRLVAVAYADWERAQAPPPQEVAAFAQEAGCGAFLLDTFHKDGLTLLDWLAPAEISDLAEGCRAAGVRVALAGSLGPQEMLALRGAAPDWFAVRGAVCRAGVREEVIDPQAVRCLVDFVEGFASSPSA